MHKSHKFIVFDATDSFKVALKVLVLNVNIRSSICNLKKCLKEIINPPQRNTMVKSYHELKKFNLMRLCFLITERFPLNQANTSTLFYPGTSAS